MALTLTVNNKVWSVLYLCRVSSS